MRSEIKALVKAGNVTPAALGQTLGMAGLNIGKVVADINTATKQYSGMKIPIIISYDVGTKEYQIITKTPPTSQLILKESGAPKAIGNREAPGPNIKFSSIITIAKKKVDVLHPDLKKAALIVLGSCESMGVTVEGKPAKEIQKEVKTGKYDSQIK